MFRHVSIQESEEIWSETETIIADVTAAYVYHLNKGMMILVLKNCFDLRTTMIIVLFLFLFESCVAQTVSFFGQQGNIVRNVLNATGKKKSFWCSIVYFVFFNKMLQGCEQSKQCVDTFISATKCNQTSSKLECDNRGRVTRL